MSAYEFDRRLRKLVIEQLEVVEIMFRSRISYLMSYEMHGKRFDRTSCI